MTTPPAVPPDTVPRPPRRSQLKPILITLLCAILLAAGSCFGFVSTINSPNNPAANWYVVGFLAGVAAIPVVIVWAIVAMILYFVRVLGEQP